MSDTIISLIIATLGRDFELYRCIESIAQSNFDFTQYELIIVDQNQKGFLNFDKLKLRYPDLRLVYIRSEVKGLSHNRNVGLAVAKGKYIAFPDDDCAYYPDTLASAVNFLDKTKNSFVLGRIYDLNKRKNVLRSWPVRELTINKINFYYLNSSITLFFRYQNNLEFDPDMGVGSKYGSCEDADFLYRLIASGSNGVYKPTINVWHPPAEAAISHAKVKNYASGFGYFLRKNKSKHIFLIFLAVYGKQILRVLSLSRDPSGRISRFINFNVGLLLGLKG